MLQIRPDRLGLLVLCVALGVFLSMGTLLPRATTQVVASPDETAVALFARGWSAREGFKLPTGIPDAAASIPGLHPRSMVQQGAWLVPVGFLGMPLLALPFEKIWEGSSAYLTALLVASSVFPLWQFARRLGVRAAIVACISYLSFPVVLLYANRGLFPNLPVVALALWSVWLLGEKARWKIGVGGLLLGVALTIRPVEAVWLLPWAAWSMWRSRKTTKPRDRWIALIAAVAFPLLGAVAAMHTYQSLMPTIGYWLRDTVQTVAPATAPAVSEIQTAHVLPFGIHPRTLQLNIRLFWLEMLWPWVLLACAGLVQLWWRDQLTWKTPALWLGAWTVFILSVLYGQATYLDNIRGTPALGNSFLRYMLPLVPLIALSIGAWAEAMMRNKARTAIVTMMVAVLACWGVGTALARDEESILATQTELRRYADIRAEAARILMPGTVVISERSDKIFAGLPGIVAVSPLPDDERTWELLRARVFTALFHRTLSEEEQEASPIKKEPILENGNERLYHLYRSSLD